METTKIIKEAAVKQRMLSNSLIVLMVAMVFANIAAEMHMTMLPLYMRYLGADVLQTGIFSLPAPAIGAFIWKTISPGAPFYITAGFTLITVIPAWLKFKLDSDDLERSARAKGD